MVSSTTIDCLQNRSPSGIPALDVENKKDLKEKRREKCWNPALARMSMPWLEGSVP
jgi:hypothetical protein